MKRFVILALIIGFALLAEAAMAQSPVQIVEQLIADVSRKHSVQPVADHLDWQGAFKAMDPAMKEQMGFKSVEDFKKHELEAYSNSGEQVRESINRAIKSSDPRQKAILEATKEHLDTSLENQKAEADKAYIRTHYSVGKSKIDRDTAQVDLVKDVDGTITTQTLDFVQVDGNWKLKSGAAFNPSGSKGPPSQSMLGPSVSSPDESVVRPF
jgi:hypothetical protein